jgi:hypothetical protein
MSVLKVPARFRAQRLGNVWLVLDVNGSKVMRLTGSAAEVLTRLEAGAQHLPDHLGPAVDGLAAAGVLEAPPGTLSRRHLLGASAATAAVAALGATIGLDALRLPAAAEASSSEPALGGSISEYTFESVTYRVHTFNGDGTFTVKANHAPMAVDVLVVGGGGGGGSSGTDYGGGGGGGGGVLFRTDLEALTAGTYAVTVGAGGAGGSDGQRGADGGTSRFADLVEVLGGGGGGGTVSAGAASGGSGGGGSSGNFESPGGAGTALQGNNGGSGVLTTSAALRAGGGGGGAGAAGTDGTADTVKGTGGNGGVGRPVGVAALGQYVGGGGGGSGEDNSGGLGSNGGGGAAGANGDAKTGGGGGAQRGPVAAGTGGSGIVIVRYPFTSAP